LASWLETSGRAWLHAVFWSQRRCPEPLTASGEHVNVLCRACAMGTDSTLVRLFYDVHKEYQKISTLQIIII